MAKDNFPNFFSTYAAKVVTQHSVLETSIKKIVLQVIVAMPFLFIRKESHLRKGVPLRIIP